MTALLAAFQFLTIMPAVVRRAFTMQELGRSVGFYPLVGLGLGGLLLGLHNLLILILPSNVVMVLLLTVWLLATRALHFDGFLDMCDGLFGRFTPEARLEIMRDSRVGAFAVAGGVMLLLLKYVVLTALPIPWIGLLLAPVIGRWVVSLALISTPYARDLGMGRDIKDNAGWPQAMFASVTALVTAWLIAGWMGLIALALSAIFLLGASRYVLARIPGLTGDIYGAFCELTELLVLLVFTTGFTL